MRESPTVHPDLEEFLKGIPGNYYLGEVLLQRQGNDRFELRHRSDEGATAGSLKTLTPESLLELVQWTKEGTFRPLRSAPNLQSGWRLEVAGHESLHTCLNHLYPGAVA